MGWLPGGSLQTSIGLAVWIFMMSQSLGTGEVQVKKKRPNRELDLGCLVNTTNEFL